MSNDTSKLTPEMSESTHVIYVPASQIHKSVRNILANEYGINREKIAEMVNEKVNAAVKERLDRLFETKTMEEFIAKQIGSRLGATSNWDSTPMKSVIKDAIQRQISELVNTSMSVTLNLNHNPQEKK